MIIYKITNKINHKVYIGQTIQSINKRWQKHIQCMKNGDNRHLYQSMRSYGLNNFMIEQIDSASSLDELNKKEKYWVDYYNAKNNLYGYNNMDGGVANPMNFSNIKEKHDYKMRTPETREKISISMKKLREEKGFSESTRKKISEKLKGNQHFKGKKRTKEAIEKTAQSLRKSVYCIDISGNILASFDSVKSAALWWVERDFCGSNYRYICNKIKDSYLKNKYIKNIKWVYKLKCVETSGDECSHVGSKWNRNSSQSKD